MSLKNAAELNSTAQRINSSLKNTSSTRVREPIIRSRGKVRGQFPSTKMGRMIAWESQLERRACYLFEFCKAVEAFREQPIRKLPKNISLEECALIKNLWDKLGTLNEDQVVVIIYAVVVFLGIGQGQTITN